MILKMPLRCVLGNLVFYIRYGEYSNPQNVHVFVHRRTARVAKQWENMLKGKNIRIYWHTCT